MISYKEKLHNISTLIFDMDGVLTDGMVLLYNGEVIRNLNSKDSYVLQYAAKMGYQVFVITGGNSQEVQVKLTGLGLTEVVLNAKNKWEAFQVLADKYGLKMENCLYMGDDIPDMTLLRKIGFSSCPQDAVQEVKATVDYVSPFGGGKGCVRDIVEQVMKVQKKWLTDTAFEW